MLKSEHAVSETTIAEFDCTEATRPEIGGAEVAGSALIDLNATKPSNVT